MRWTRRLVVLWIMVGLAVHTVQAEDENELKNGDFSKGRFGWRGDGKAVTLDAAEAGGGDGKCLVVELDPKKIQFVYQKVRFSKKVTTVTVKLRFRPGKDKKTDECVPGVITLRLAEDRHSGKADIETKRKGRKVSVWLESDEKWTAQEWTVTELKSPRGVETFEIAFDPGKGLVYVDDIVLTVKEE